MIIVAIVKIHFITKSGFTYASFAKGEDYHPTALQLLLLLL